MGVGRLTRAVAVASFLALLTSACGGSSGETGADNATLRSSGEITIDADKVVESTSSTTASGATGAVESDDDGAGDDGDIAPEDSADQTTETTLPQQEKTPAEEMFEAIEEFMSCLDADGFTFIGLPTGGDADAPENQQPYIDALIACAARSDVQNKIAAADASLTELSPEEIEEVNRTFIEVRTCLTGRGWLVPEPTPDENGLLFAGFGEATTWQPPPGQSITESDDIDECSAVADDVLQGNS